MYKSLFKEALNGLIGREATLSHYLQEALKSASPPSIESLINLKKELKSVSKARMALEHMSYPDKTSVDYLSYQVSRRHKVFKITSALRPQTNYKGLT